MVKALEDPQNCRSEPIALGTLNLRGKESNYLGTLPFDALQLLYILMKDGKIKFLILCGPLLSHGTSDIRSVHFEKEYIPEDWNADPVTFQENEVSNP